jgi:hypothetical protein
MWPALSSMERRALLHYFARPRITTRFAGCRPLCAFCKGWASSLSQTRTQQRRSDAQPAATPRPVIPSNARDLLFFVFECCVSWVAVSTVTSAFNRQGTTSVVPMHCQERGFSPCGHDPLPEPAALIAQPANDPTFDAAQPTSAIQTTLFDL